MDDVNNFLNQCCMQKEGKLFCNIKEQNEQLLRVLGSKDDFLWLIKFSRCAPVICEHQNDLRINLMGKELRILIAVSYTVAEFGFGDFKRVFIRGSQVRRRAWQAGAAGTGPVRACSCRRAATPVCVPSRRYLSVRLSQQVASVGLHVRVFRLKFTPFAHSSVKFTHDRVG